jgi:hypothetical protein
MSYRILHNLLTPTTRNTRRQTAGIGAHPGQSQKCTSLHRPKTLRGKRTVSRNAITHGILAREVVITAGDREESLEEFRALVEGLVNSYQPVGVVEEALVQMIATALWRKARVLRAENGEIRKQLDSSAADRALRNSDKGNFDLALAEMELRLHNAENPIDQKVSTMDRLSAGASRPEQFAGTLFRPGIPECPFGGREGKYSKLPPRDN